MFDNERFLNDLVDYCLKHKIKFYDLTYTEQLACIRSLLVGIARNSPKLWFILYPYFY